MPLLAKIKIIMGFDVKITTILNVLDLLAPFSCRGCGARGSLLCECCKNYNIKRIPGMCSRCRKKLESCSCEVPVVFSGYREGVLMRITEDYKYKSIRATALVLAEIMAETVSGLEKAGRLSGDRSDVGSSRSGDADEVVVVPLPTISRHVRERGFDHTWLLAKKLAKLKGWKAERILERRNKTVQVGANEAKRKEQASKAYGVAKKWLERGLDANRTYLLIDDVWTTGASMEAAIAAMRAAGAKKIAAAVILAPRDSKKGEPVGSPKSVG